MNKIVATIYNDFGKIITKENIPNIPNVGDKITNPNIPSSILLVTNVENITPIFFNKNKKVFYINIFTKSIF